MNSLVIHCTTCRARLKVTDESAIGGIYACPKCGSMVQVLPPPETQAAAPSAPAPKHAPAKTRSAKPQTTKPQAQSTPQATTPAPVQTRGSQPAATPPPLPARKAAAAAAILPVASALPDASVSPPAAVSAAPVSKFAFVLHFVRQEPWLFGGALAAGIAIGTIIWFAIASGDSAKAEPEPSAAPQNPPAVAAAGKDNQPRHKPTSGRQFAGGAQAAADPRRAVAVEPSPVQPETSEEGPTREESPAIDDPVDGAEPEAAEGPDAEPDAESEPRDVSPMPPTGPESSKHLEIASRLAARVQAMDFRKVPLSHFISFISELSAAKIDLDLPALKAAGKGPDTPVTVQIQETTVEAALKAALESHGLVCAVRGDRLVVTTKQAAAEMKPAK